jgi:hypothetical protein
MRKRRFHPEGTENTERQTQHEGPRIWSSAGLVPLVAPSLRWTPDDSGASDCFAVEFASRPFCSLCAMGTLSEKNFFFAPCSPCPCEILQSPLNSHPTTPGSDGLLCNDTLVSYPFFLCALRELCVRTILSPCSPSPPCETLQSSLQPRSAKIRSA